MGKTLTCSDKTSLHGLELVPSISRRQFVTYDTQIVASIEYCLRSEAHTDGNLSNWKFELDYVNLVLAD
jgi:hypothetical protein